MATRTFLIGGIKFGRLTHFRLCRFKILFETGSIESPSVIGRLGVSVLAVLRVFGSSRFGVIMGLMLMGSGSSRLDHLERLGPGFTD
jgi:hypothetical protein